MGTNNITKIGGKMKKYSSTWSAKKLTVNFNHKQWRQDIADYIKEKKSWSSAFVTRSKIDDDKTKFFEIFNETGQNFIIKYSKECDVEYSDDDILVNEYLGERS